MSRAYSLTRLADVEPERPLWLWPGHIPKGKIVLIDGDPATGKSTLALDIAAHVTTGAAWPDGSAGCEPANVLLLTAEDGLADTVSHAFAPHKATHPRCSPYRRSSRMARR